ncbi:MAG: hypothetical protein F9K30_24410 [Dechloromonas sp.]|nr:MAG: hypothetical protein F9K30_24410 [Dechloromonas sp.]
MNIPPDCDIRTEYCHDLPMLEEELEVDRLTIQWGFGDRNEYTYWETAVFYAKTLECDDIYRMYRAHLPKAK